MKDLSDCRLYGILDLSYVDISDATRVAEAMIEGGVDLIQLRGKQQSVNELVDLASDLHKITCRSSVPLIANDYAEIAQKVPVEGVHVGQEDDAISLAREKAGRVIGVGKSTHNLTQAAAAQHEGADYIGFGPIFATPTKPDYAPIGLTEIARVHVDLTMPVFYAPIGLTEIARVHIDLTMPVFCIGGIKIDNLEQVIAAGARRVAIVSGLLKAPDIVEYARACKKLLIADL